MDDLLIVGARGFGREVCHFAATWAGHGTEWRIKGFLDDGRDLAATALPCALLGSVEAYEVRPHDVFVCALGSVAAKRRYVRMVLDKGGRFINLVSVLALGVRELTCAGTIVSPFCTVGPNVSLGSFVTIQAFTSIGHDCAIGEFSQIGGHAFLGGGARVGSGVQMYTRSAIMPAVVVATNAVVGAGSVVLRDVPADVTVVGAPATILTRNERTD